MRRTTVIMLFLACFSWQAVAQVLTPVRNSFVSFGAAPGYYAGGVCGGGELSLGKWILTSTALRGQMNVMLAAGNSSSMHPFYFGHVDLAVDVLTAARGRNLSNIWRSYVFLGGGVVRSSLGDNDFCALVGLGGEYRVSDDWRLYAELKSTLFPAEFDNNSSASLMTALAVGMVYDIAANPTRSRSRFETKQFANDWFFNVAIGVTSLNYSGIASLGQRLSQLTPAFEFGLGKRLTTFWQVRLSASGLYAKSEEELFTYYNLRGDIMVDPVSLFYIDNPHTLFTARPYLGVGVVSRLDNQTGFLISPAAGMQLVVRPDKRNQLYLEARYMLTPPRFINSSIDQHTLSVGLASLVAGYSYTFSDVSFK